MLTKVKRGLFSFVRGSRKVKFLKGIIAYAKDVVTMPFGSGSLVAASRMSRVTCMADWMRCP